MKLPLLKTILVTIALLCVAADRARASIGLGTALDGASLTWQSGGAAPWAGQNLVTHDGTDAASSGLIVDSQESWIRTTVVGPGMLRFWWRVSSEVGYDQLQFLIDNVELNNISGDIPWESRVIEVPSGSHELQWRYAKDFGESDGLDRGWLDEVSFTPTGDIAPTILTPPTSQTVATGMPVRMTVTATGIPAPGYQWRFNGVPIPGATGSQLELGEVATNQSGRYTVVVANYLGSVTSAPAVLTVTFLADGLDTTGLDWRVGGHGSWFTQTEITHDGADAAESGSITNSQECWMETSVIGPGRLDFWWRVSSEADYDLLQLLIDGTVAAGLSGEVGWESRTYYFTPGPRVLRWRYAKDGSLSAGQDKAWIDQVTFTPNRAPSSLNFNLGSGTIQENDVLVLSGSFVDPDATDTHTVVVDWGDGTSPAVSRLTQGVRSLVISHLYLDDDPTGTPLDNYLVRVTVSDEYGSAVVSLPLQVRNVPPVLRDIALTPAAIFPGESVTLVGKITDVGRRDTVRLQVNWGDGAPVETLSFGTNNASFNLHHRYTVVATNVLVTLTALDDDGDVTTVRTNQVVRPIPVRPTMLPLPAVASNGAQPLRLEGSPSAVYQFQASTDLRCWTTIAIRTADAQGLIAAQDRDRSLYPMRFYRAVWQSQTPGASFTRVHSLTNGTIRIELAGFPGTTYRIDKTSDLTNWTSWISKPTDTNGYAFFEDAEPTGARRFYRAVSP